MEKSTQKTRKKRQLPQLTQVEKRKFTLVALVGWRQNTIEQNGKKQHKKTAIALVDLGPKTEICPSWLAPKKMSIFACADCS